MNRSLIPALALAALVAVLGAYHADACKFRSKARTRSTRKCAVIPLEKAHPFHSKARSHSDAMRACSTGVRQSVRQCAIAPGEGGLPPPSQGGHDAQKETVHANHPRSSATEMAVRSVPPRHRHKLPDRSHRC